MDRVIIKKLGDFGQFVAQRTRIKRAYIQDCTSSILRYQSVGRRHDSFEMVTPWIPFPRSEGRNPV